MGLLLHLAFAACCLLVALALLPGSLAGWLLSALPFVVVGAFLWGAAQALLAD